MDDLTNVKEELTAIKSLLLSYLIRITATKKPGSKPPNTQRIKASSKEEGDENDQ